MLAFITAPLLVGCHLEYHVSMTPNGDTLDREVVVSSDIESLELERLQRAMGPHTPLHRNGDPGQQPPRLIFNDHVSGSDWPDGFGGTGAWTIHTSPLGTADCFLECLGGDVSAVDDILALQRGIDAVVKRVRRQLRTELAGDPMLPRMLRLLNDRVHPDAADAAVLGWALLFSSHMLPDAETTGIGPGRDRMQAYIKARMSSAAVAFLWQRGWVTTSEAQLAAMAEDPSDLDGPRIAARALDLDMDGDWEGQLEHIEDLIKNAFPEKFEDELLAAFTSAVGNRTRLAVAWSATSAILTSREVTVRLKSPEQPTTTNGTWSKESGQVEWSLDTAPLAVGLTAPPLCWSATWARPDEEAQRRILGQVCIDGDDLVAFATRWSAASSDQQQSIRHILKSFSTARSGTNIKVEADDVRAECRQVFTH